MKRRIKAITAAMSAAAVIVVVGAGTVVMVRGQAVGDLPRMPGMTDYTPMINLQNQQMLERNIMQNMMDSQELARRGGQASVQAEINRMEGIGAAKIKAGKATIRFTPSLAGTKVTISNMTWNDEGDPQTLDGQIKYVQRYVKQFETLMLKNGYTPNDSSDGYAFAYALAYAAANNRDLDKAEVEKIRQNDRSAALKDSFYQGMSDEKKQKWYEINVLMAMQAVEQRIKYRRATSEAEREKYDESAKRFAQALLKTQ